MLELTQRCDVDRLERPKTFELPVDGFVVHAVCLRHLQSGLLIGLPENSHHLVFGKS